jgi:2-keto-4-pentenoate hydratase/2-oxohepta-3-ene-1,7-dioic acid hydratase in catechol pathway
MGFLRFLKDDETPRPGFRHGDRVVDLDQAPPDISETMDEIGYLRTIESLHDVFQGSVPVADDSAYVSRIDDVDLARPLVPNKFVTLHGCYTHDLDDETYDPHLKGETFHKQEWPSLSVAPRSSLRGPDDSLRLPSYATDVRPGAAVGLVVGERISDVGPETALDAVAGYTPMTTLQIFDSVPDIEGYKLYDGSFSFGPTITQWADGALEDLSLEVSIHGRSVETRTTSDWRFSPGELIAEACRVLTLEPGDLVSTGSPSRIQEAVSDGDVFETRVGGTPPLTNTVRRDGANVE